MNGVTMKEFRRETVTLQDGIDIHQWELDGWKLIHAMARCNEKGVYDYYFERDTETPRKGHA